MNRAATTLTRAADLSIIPIGYARRGRADRRIPGAFAPQAPPKRDANENAGDARLPTVREKNAIHEAFR